MPSTSFPFWAIPPPNAASHGIGKGSFDEGKDKKTSPLDTLTKAICTDTGYPVAGHLPRAERQPYCQPRLDLVNTLWVACRDVPRKLLVTVRMEEHSEPSASAIWLDEKRRCGIEVRRCTIYTYLSQRFACSLAGTHTSENK
ncbi:hypothetical protein M404DRAFT_28678 [Pisolithus tinctorius Marx 270]|uniref:Uncharacterized protein n=1 Tax=Pisolithus tinctorius Marx 270 TaxID=870435 RepID=A0A0C3P255_PISTI|nr:hypothetical protein M404DRAFT_28678 [Pisolithus tinctorius Marx 270]